VWLLAGAVGGVDEFLITHEFLGQMLGPRRATVTLSAGILQAAGFIKYRRGVVTIVRLRLHDKDGNRVTATRVSEGEWDYEAPPGERVFLLSGRWQDNELLVGPVIAHVFVVSEADTDAARSDSWTRGAGNVYLRCPGITAGTSGTGDDPTGGSRLISAVPVRKAP
jgi:hypothetical protein